jgi:hypothetical protein
MMKKVFVVLLSLVLTGSVIAQEKPDSLKNWKKGGDFSFTFSQVTLNNWAAGGKNSMAGTALLNTFANFKKNKSVWDNSLTIGYGLTKQGSDNLVKTEDRFYITSKYGYSAGKAWYYSGLVDLKTQMTTGYQDPPANTIEISKMFSPAYLLISLGMDYKPNDNFSAYLSPLTSKMTIVMDDTLSAAGAYGVEPGKNIREEYGASVKSVYKKANLIKNVDFFTRLDLFSNLGENPQNIDVDWEARFNMKINSFLSAVVAINMLYDDDIKYVNSKGVEKGARLQTKQLLGFGLNFKF